MSTDPHNIPTLHHRSLTPADAALCAQALRIADAQCIVEIECNGLAERRQGLTWYDVRPMLDARENCAEVVDINTEMLAYAERRGIVVRHPITPWLLRVAVPSTVTPAQAGAPHP